MADSNTEDKKSWKRQKITGALVVGYGVMVGIILYYQDTEMYFRMRYAIASGVIFIIVIAGARLVAWAWTNPGSTTQRTDDDQDRCEVE